MEFERVVNNSDSFPIGGDVGYEMPRWSNREAIADYREEKVKRIKRPKLDMPFLMLTLIILMIGLIMVLSASFVRSYYMEGDPTWFFTRQIAFAALGIVSLLVISRVKIRTISKFSIHTLAISIGLLVLVLIIGLNINGATRWIGIEFGSFSITFQPSEIAKLAVVMAFAQMICKFGDKMRTLKYGVFPFVVIAAIITLLLYEQPHLSAAVIIILISAVMMLAGGTRLKWFIIGGLLVTLALAAVLVPHLIAYYNANEGSQVSISQAVVEASRNLGYAGRRISAWIDPDADPLSSGFQTRQSLLAIGSGGLFGQGLGQSRQKFLYLPEEHNDFIFSVVSEELGFIGVMLVLSLFALLIIRGFWISVKVKDRYGSLLVFGITSMLAIQVFLNVGVVTNLIPATGISLPFFSYGGTALLLQLFKIGLILAVSREIQQNEISQNEKRNDL
jgi:cell division protein FtsW